MKEVVLSFVYESPWTSLLLCYIIFCYVTTHVFQRAKVDLIYKKDSLMDRIVSASNLDKMEYVPYMFAWSVHL